MSDKQVAVDVHEVMQHLRLVGPTSCFILNEDGHGALDLDGEPTMRWAVFSEFVHKFRGLGRKAAEKRLIKAAFECSRIHDSQDHETCPQLVCECDACREYRVAILSLRNLRADHD